jgi:hypothetical protein
MFTNQNKTPRSFLIIAAAIFGGLMLLSKKTEATPPGNGNHDIPPEGDNGCQIFGVVTDANTGESIPGADVFIYPMEEHNYSPTGHDGRYSFDAITPGLYELTFEKSGYQSKVVNVNAVADDNLVDVVLEPTLTDAVTIDALSIKINPSIETIDLRLTLTNYTGETLQDISNLSLNNELELVLYILSPDGSTPGSYFEGPFSFTRNKTLLRVGDLAPGTNVKTWTLPRQEYIGDVGWFEHEGMAVGVRGYATWQFMRKDGSGDGSILIATPRQYFTPGTYQTTWQNWPINTPVKPGYWAEHLYPTFPPSWWPTSENGTWVLVTHPYYNEWISDEFQWLLPGEVAAYLAANSGWGIAP